MNHDEKDKEASPTTGVSRRGFIASVGTGAIGAAAAVTIASAAPAEPPPITEIPAGEVSTIALTVNGRRHKMLVEPRWSLLFVLRDQLGLTGTKVGCERGECGACTVLIDGKARYACMTLAVEADGHDITTIEGVMKGEELGTTQQAFADEDAFQCGYCTPGQVMAAEGLLRVNPSPTIDDIRQGMAGNICRCGAYAHIFKAVAKAADLKQQGR
ncbi:MAG: (2Fe-2S)-binding protein [Acidobacteria bacterium]|nr:(2Fe-2S)-binding protein [Acidobacteriota bacterium]